MTTDPTTRAIGWNILHSLYRVGAGFGLAALVGIPLGFMIGRFSLPGRHDLTHHQPAAPGVAAGLAADRPVRVQGNRTRLALGDLYLQHLADHPQHAAGVSRVPQDYLNVARVLNLSEWKIFTRILFPSVLPHLMTGIRLSIGVAWLVIVAAEMLTGGTGLGFWVWDEWNNLNVEHILIAIFIVGIVGLLLEQSCWC
jgi:nitrate/nitrite transport system permease protein